MGIAASARTSERLNSGENNVIIHGTGIEQIDAHIRKLDTATHTIYWEGLVFKDGLPAGKPSVEAFANELSNVPVASTTLRGIYFLVVREKSTGDSYVFGDQSGLLHLFTSDTVVSNSLLDICVADRLGYADLDPQAVVDFLTYGYLTFGRTLTRKVKRLHPEQIAHVRRGAPVSFIPRPLREIAEPPKFSVEDVLRNLANAVKSPDEKVSLDLTGGIDTRLVAITLDYYGLKFEVAHAGTRGSIDMEIAAEVAQALGRELVITHHDPSTFEAVLPELFRFCDGLLDVSKDHLGLQMQHDRLARGITLVIAGDGGPLHKDQNWLQDFPFYARRTANIQKFCNYRVAPVVANYDLFSQQYAGLARTYRLRALDFIRKYQVPGNTQTYDNVYFHLNAPDSLGRFASNHVRMIDVYSPLCERDAVAYSFHLPRTQRFFNNFHRNSMTRLNPRVARIHTTEGGISGSGEWSKVAGDFARYTLDKMSRVQKKLAQRFLNKPYRHDFSPISSKLYDNVRSCAAMRDAVEDLRGRGILNPQIALNDIPDGSLGPMLTLHLTIKHLESANRVGRPVALCG